MSILREPLLHFILLGTGLFVLFNVVDQASSRPPRQIVITAAKIEHLAATFARTWQRPPDDAELDGLIQDHIREEVLYRQALELGLDRDDTIIRRRLRQKMEFIAADVAAQRQPTDAELRTFMEDHAADYRLDDRFTFRHIYLDPDEGKEDAAGAAARLLAGLNSGTTNPDLSGDTFLLPLAFRDTARKDIASAFGEEFAATLSDAPVGRWHGPLTSAYGVHLVFIEEHKAGSMPSLDDVRDAVRRDWERLQRVEANEEFVQTLLQDYAVQIERRQPVQ